MISNRIDLPEADLTLWTGLDVPAMETLVAATAWRQDSIRLYGRVYPQPRLVAWHGDPGAAYRYSGLMLQPAPWTSALRRLRRLAEQASGARFNAVLLNYYRDGRDSMGLHSDDEPELGPAPVIASFSLGAERRLLLVRRGDRAMRHRVALPHGSLLVMAGATQAGWKHGIEKQRRPIGPRLNLTFRRIVAGARPLPTASEPSAQ